MPRDPRIYLEDVITSCEKITTYTTGMTKTEFSEDTRTVDAVLRNLEIIGEAVKNVPVDIRSLDPEVDWKRIAGFRDIVAHHYFAVKLETVWDVVITRIEPLRESVQALLERLDSPDA